jgi:TPR repeat protein
MRKWPSEALRSFPADESQTGKLFKKVCDDGSAKGCYHLGVCYANGECGLARDRAAARPLLRKCCAAGEKAACSAIEEMKEQGDRSRPRGPRSPATRLSG